MMEWMVETYSELHDKFAVLDVPVGVLLAVYSAAIFAAISIQKDVLAIPEAHFAPEFGKGGDGKRLAADLARGVFLASCQCCIALFALALVGLHKTLSWEMTDTYKAVWNSLAMCGGYAAVLALGYLATKGMRWRSRLSRGLAKLEAQLMPAVIQFRSGRKIRGYLHNLAFLNGNQHVIFRSEKGSARLLSRSAIVAIFIGESQPKSGWMIETLFDEPPQTYVFGTDSEEVFPDAPSCRLGEFRLLSNTKPGSNTRYVIVRDALLRYNWD